MDFSSTSVGFVLIQRSTPITQTHAAMVLSQTTIINSVFCTSHVDWQWHDFDHDAVLRVTLLPDTTYLESLNHPSFLSMDFQ